jgi:hypothetical protein
MKHRKKIALGVLFAGFFVVQVAQHDVWYSLGYATSGALAYTAMGVIAWRGMRVTLQNWKASLKAWVQS